MTRKRQSTRAENTITATASSSSSDDHPLITTAQSPTKRLKATSGAATKPLLTLDDMQAPILGAEGGEAHRRVSLLWQKAAEKIPIARASITVDLSALRLDCRLGRQTAENDKSFAFAPIADNTGWATLCAEFKHFPKSCALKGGSNSGGEANFSFPALRIQGKLSCAQKQSASQGAPALFFEKGRTTEVKMGKDLKIWPHAVDLALPTADTMLSCFQRANERCRGHMGAPFAAGRIEMLIPSREDNALKVMIQDFASSALLRIFTSDPEEFAAKASLEAMKRFAFFGCFQLGMHNGAHALLQINDDDLKALPISDTKWASHKSVMLDVSPDHFQGETPRELLDS